jgi:hypothetical protein
MTVGRLVRAIAWRVLHDTEYLVYVAAPLEETPCAPSSFALVRVTPHGRTDEELALQAMLAAGEPPCVAERLAQGHQLFGWKQGERVVTFGWACDRDRVIGARPAREVPGRVFLYNFQTLPEFRGNGLYPALLCQMRYLLGQEGNRQFVIDVSATNLASRRGIEKAGFSLLATTKARTCLRRVRWEVRSGKMAGTLVAPEGIW